MLEMKDLNNYFSIYFQNIVEIIPVRTNQLIKTFPNLINKIWYIEPCKHKVDFIEVSRVAVQTSHFSQPRILEAQCKDFTWLFGIVIGHIFLPFKFFENRLFFPFCSSLLSSQCRFFLCAWSEINVHMFLKSYMWINYSSIIWTNVTLTSLMGLYVGKIWIISCHVTFLYSS